MKFKVFELNKKTTHPAYQQPRVPSLADAHPDYATLESKERELTTKHRDLERDQSDLTTRLHRFLSGGDKAVDADVAELLGDPVDPSETDPRPRLGEIARELRTVSSALDVVRRRKMAVTVEASKAVCDDVRAFHAAVSNDLIQALVVAARASAALGKLADDLTYQGVYWTGILPPMHRSKWFGNGVTDFGVTGQIIRDAIQAGVISPESVPGEMR